MNQREDKPGDFLLFAVTEKKNEKGPDYTGHIITPDGVKKRVAAWKRKSGNGLVFLSGNVEFEERSFGQGSKSGYGGSSRRDDDIPF